MKRCRRNPDATFGLLAVAGLGAIVYIGGTTGQLPASIQNALHQSFPGMFPAAGSTSPPGGTVPPGGTPPPGGTASYYTGLYGGGQWQLPKGIQAYIQFLHQGAAADLFVGVEAGAHHDNPFGLGSTSFGSLEKFVQVGADAGQQVYYFDFPFFDLGVVAPNWDFWTGAWLDLRFYIKQMPEYRMVAATSWLNNVVTVT